MFRRLYWVTELLQADGRSRVLGIYTSIPDLIRRGTGLDLEGELRLTLMMADTDREAFGVWQGPDFAGLEEACQEFIRTEEFSIDEVKHLIEALQQRNRAAA